MNKAVSEYFLGESTPSGFKTDFFSELKKNGIYTYILKGGPGTGKSGLMKKIAETFKNKDEIELYHCSSDPDSLDAVVLKKAKTAIVDGTSPHTYDPVYAGVSDCIINLGEYWDKNKLMSEKQNIISASDKTSEYHLRSRQLISAFVSVNQDIYQSAKAFLLTKKFNSFCERFLKKYLPKKLEKESKVAYKKISAFSKNGYCTMPVNEYKIVIVDDLYYYGSSMLMQKIYSKAAEYGYDCVISIFNMLKTPMIEHIIIPELEIIFMTKNPVNKISEDDSNIISKVNFRRFYDREKIKERKFRLDFSQKVASELLDEAVECVVNAKYEHDILEKYYIDSVDFKEIDKQVERLINEIEKCYI